MDVEEQLRHLPDPDPDAMERVWKRYRNTRRQTVSRPRVGWLLTAGVVAAALAGVYLRSGETTRRAVLASQEAPTTEAWSDQVQLLVDGRGEIVGKPKDAEIHWRAGTVTASVEPHAGNRLSVITEEARVDVLGTVFSVSRDAMGVRTSVERGRVKVTCTDGWSGEIGPEDGEKLCLPVRPELLLGRADALESAGASLEERRQTLDAGLERAKPGTAVAGELLFRRMQVRGEAGDLQGALEDVDRYLSEPRPRSVEVLRYAGWKALAGPSGCEEALPYLSRLELTGTPEDRVLLAECVAPDQPQQARTWLDDAVPRLQGAWLERAERLRATLD